jgi:uncharacterized protein
VVGLLYLDASALVKLVVDEAGTGAMVARVRGARGVVTSVIAGVEVPRAVARTADAVRATELLDRSTLVDVSQDIIRRAATLEPSSVRSLDAIHVATALALGPEIDAFVTYDRRQAAAAAAAGLVVESPGREMIPREL